MMNLDYFSYHLIKGNSCKGIKTFLVLLIINSGVLKAQLPVCGNEYAIPTLSSKIPSLNETWQKTNALIREKINNHSRGGVQGIFTIPVVVHIVFHDSTENISDAQIFSQIDVLNEDYRRLNTDTNITRSIFKNIAGDAHIEFCLAQRDSSDNTTNGITRTFTSHVSWDCTDSMKFTTYGGIDPWPNDKYLNIWVVNLNCANGYAYYPGTPAPYDGVVVHYYVFGKTGNVAPGHNGRTATHEVGHWLGLYHTFEYGLCNGTDTSTCGGGGDFICDTPSSDAPGYGCDTTLNTCIDSPADFPNEIENYMDYADDVCRNMFSLGQIERMRASLSSYRISLFTSPGCVSPLSNYYDASLVEILQPLDEICSSVYIPVIRIGNNGSNNLYSVKINFQLDGGNWNQIIWTGNLTSGSTAVVNLPSVNVTPGTHNYSCFVSDPDSMPDQDAGNDVGNILFDVLSQGDGYPIPFTEGFQSSSFPPPGWYISNPGYNRTWEKNSDAGGFGLSSASACFRNFYNGSTNTSDGLISQKFDFTSVSDIILTFDVAYAIPNSTFYSDTLKVYYSTDCGMTWNFLWKKGGIDLSTAPATFDEFIPDSSQWRTEIVNGNIVSGYPLVSFMFEDVSYWSNNLYVDNINITSTASLEKILVKNNWRIYPNPSNGNFIIESVIHTGGFQYRVYSPLGQKILENYCNNKSQSIELNSLDPGIYFIELIMKENICVMKIEIEK